MGFQWISWVSPPFYFAVCVTNFHFLKNISLYIGAKFFPLWDASKHTLRARWSCILVHCHKTLADRMYPVAIAEMFASANDKGRGILRSSSKRRQETTNVGPVGLHSLPPPTPYGRLSYVVFVVGTMENYSGGYKCQFSVKILAIFQLSGNPVQTLQNVICVLKKDRGRLFLPIGGKGGGGGRGGNGMFNFIFSPRPLPLFTSLRRRWKFHNCFTCEFTAHCASKNAEMNLKSTTTNGFNLRIINSLMALAGYAWPGLTVKLAFYPYLLKYK